MARDKELLEARNAKVRKMFNSLRAQKSGRGKRMYSVEQVLYRIANEMFISERTIERIIYEGDKKTPKKRPPKAHPALAA